MQIKQVIIIRRDLHLRKGQIAAQAAHASIKVFLDRAERMSAFEHSLVINLTDAMKHWVDGIFTKICVGVDSEKELLDIYNAAGAKDIPCSIIKETGFEQPTNTCIALGPDRSELLDTITGHLKLL